MTQGGLTQGHAAEDWPPLIQAPLELRDWAGWRRTLKEWRERRKAEMAYDERLYRQPEFQWVSSSFACCFLMLCDETFYDAQSGQYRTAEFLDRGVTEFGGFDCLVLWHAYPRIGLDDRNQFDFYRDMPGGLKGLRGVADVCHGRGVRVFIDYNPWDTGTRREPISDIDALVEMVKAIDADGIFL